MRPQVVLFAATLERGNGGLAQLARMTAKVLARRNREERIEARVVSLLDTNAPDDVELPVTACGGSRLRFVLQAWRAALRPSHFVFDQLGLSRALPPIPGLRRPTLSFLAGVEIWDSASKKQLALARRADALVAISRHTRDRADACHGGFARARVCWLATEGDAPPRPPDKRSRPPQVLMVSRCDEPYKGHDLLIDCWPQVVKAVPTARLSFAGKGQRLESLRAQAADSTARDSIEVHGFVPQERLRQLYADSTVFAMPSRGEGFGLVYVEAMRHQLPVIATVHDAGGEINADGVSGYNVNLERPEELPARLIELLRDPEKAAEFGRRAQLRWAQNFRFQSFDARFTALLEEFLVHGRL